MLLKKSPPALADQPITTANGYQHLDRRAVSVLRWLQANRIPFVLVGPVAEQIRGGGQPGPVAIVPAPFGRNFERLARALWSAHARLRVDTQPEPVPFKVTGEKLMRGQRLAFRCGEYDLDVEGRPEEAPGYQALLYEAVRFELAPDLSVEVASPEDIEHYAHLARTGSAPEIRITRGAAEPKLV